MVNFYTHPLTGKRFKLGGIETKRCIRCRELFFPAYTNQTLCPFCQNKPYSGKGRLPNHLKCSLFGCNRRHFGKGYCEIHYNQLIKTPQSTKNRKLKSAKKWLEKGAVLCQMFQECEVYFVPKAKNQYGYQKFCKSCAKKRSWNKVKKT